MPTPRGSILLQVIPHKHFHVMLRDDSFLKAGLQASTVLHSKRTISSTAGGADLGRRGAADDAVSDELEDEMVQKALRK